MREYKKTIRPYINIRKHVRGGANIVQLNNLIDSYLHRCAYCFKPLDVVTIDHFTPISRGGDNDIDNLVPCCQRCNSSKSNNSLIIWLAKKAA
jgi:5-methylcytosine-specific restriction endonuclease McrA